VIRVLLLLPFIGLMIVPFYNVREPQLFGFPFIYWYQLAWVPLKGHVSTILRKLGVGSRTQAAVLTERLAFGQPGGT